MRILITGCNGQLGWELIRIISQVEGVSEIIGTDINNLDITSQKHVFELIEDKKPDVVINCAAYTNVDGCEDDELTAFRVNAIGARNLSAAAFNVDAKIIQISTDYVFDGNGYTPKKEFDIAAPVNCYGRSKLLGEIMVKETNPRHFIIRTAWLYGEGKNFVSTMLNLSKKKDQINVVSDQIGSPTSTVDLGRCITELMITKGYGTYHATCEGCCSWYDFAVKIFDLCDIKIKVNPITSDQYITMAKRPKYSVLDNYMLKICEMNSFRDWEASLVDYINRGHLL